MRVSELSRRSGVPVPTIKYYIREGLLPGGELTAANQARYGGDHLERLALIRALREVAGLGVAAVKETLRALDATRAGPGEPGTAGGAPPLAIAMRALGGPEAPVGDVPEGALERVDALLEEVGWEVPREAAARDHLARALAAVDRHWRDGVSEEMLTAYARLAGELARLEIPDTWDPDRDPIEALRYAVLGTVLFEPVILSLRRLAHADRSRRLGERWRSSGDARR